MKKPILVAIIGIFLGIASRMAAEAIGLGIVALAGIVVIAYRELAAWRQR